MVIENRAVVVGKGWGGGRDGRDHVPRGIRELSEMMRTF